MLRDLAKDDGYVTFKRAAVDRGGWTYIASMSETCFIAEKYNTDDWELYTNYKTAGLFTWRQRLSNDVIAKDIGIQISK